MAPLHYLYLSFSVVSVNLRHFLDLCKCSFFFPFIFVIFFVNVFFFSIHSIPFSFLFYFVVFSPVETNLCQKSSLQKVETNHFDDYFTSDSSGKRHSYFRFSELLCIYLKTPFSYISSAFSSLDHFFSFIWLSPINFSPTFSPIKRMQFLILISEIVHIFTPFLIVISLRLYSFWSFDVKVSKHI